MPKTINTNLPSVSTGDVLTATAYNNAITSLNSTTVPPMCRARRSAALSLATGTIVAINFDAEDFDTDGMFTPTANFITIQTAGVYDLSATVSLNATATGQRYVGLVLNQTFSGSGDTATITSGTRLAAQANSASVDTESVVSCSTLYNLAATDKIAVLYYQSSTTTLGLNLTVQTTLSATLVGKTA